jgi:neutral ceramidase
MTGRPGEWLAGAATRVFPVAVGTPMAGYTARTGPATGIQDELTIGALVITRQEGRVVIVTADVAAVDSGLVGEVADAGGLGRDELVLCASHTHSGPAGVVPRLHPADDDRGAPELRAAFVATCAAAIGEARDRVEPVELLFGRSETSGLAANRNDPTGPFDPRVSVLATRGSDGEIGAVLVHFACHPTILGAESRLVSADFPGALRRSLSARLERSDRKPVVLFANGAAGDVSTRYTRRGQDLAEVERVGTALASAAASALTIARPVDGPVRYDRQRVPLPPRSLAEPATATNGDVDVPTSAAERRREETRAQGAALLRRLIEAGPEAVPAALDLEAWALGEVVLVAVPGELFAALGARIAEGSPSPTLVLGYANGYVGYLADEAAYEAGTYEALASPYAPGAGERVGEAGRLLASRIRMG